MRDQGHRRLSELRCLQDHSFCTFKSELKLYMMMKIAQVGFRFSYLPKYKLPLETYYKKNKLLAGFCTPEQSLAYSQRNIKVHPQNWRTPAGVKQKLTISSLGIGTFNGQPSNEHDYEMFGALAESLLSGGINHIDTCALYRFGKSQKVINAVMNYLIKEKGFKRQQFFISTKCGYIPKDIDSNLEEKDFIRILTSQNIIKKDEIVHDLHCVAPNFIEFSLQKSRMGLGLQTVDVLYLNNFSEAHLSAVGEEVTYQRLKLAFVKMEQLRRQGKIRFYGMCSYVGLRSPKDEQGVHFNLQRAIKIAKEVGGQTHGFRFLMVPFSLGTPQILLKWQNYNDGKESKLVRVFDIAAAEKINIVACSPLFQGKVAQLPFESKLLDYLQYPSAKHLQLIRSYPSQALLSTLVGMTQPSHVEQNLTLIQYGLLQEKEWNQILPMPE